MQGGSLSVSPHPLDAQRPCGRRCHAVGPGDWGGWLATSERRLYLWVMSSFDGVSRVARHHGAVAVGGGLAVALAIWGGAGVWQSHRLASAWAAWCGPGRTQGLDLWGQGQLHVGHVVCAVVFGSASLVFWGWIIRQWWLQRQLRSVAGGDAPRGER